MKDDSETNPSGLLELYKIPGVGRSLRFRAFETNQPWAETFVGGLLNDLKK